MPIKNRALVSEGVSVSEGLRLVALCVAGQILPRFLPFSVLLITNTAQVHGYHVRLTFFLQDTGKMTFILAGKLEED